MRRRWRSLRTPNPLERMRVPTANEAAGIWFLGSAWLLHALWLAWQGRAVWVPMLLVSGLVALWAWKHRGSVYWFPIAAALATLVDLLWPSTPAGGRPGTGLDLVMTGMALVIGARTIARGWPKHKRPLGERVLVTSLVLGAALALIDPHFKTPPVLRLALAGIATLAATLSAARRPLALGRPWLAFPVVAAVLGLIAIVASWTGGPLLGLGAPAIGPFLTLACSLPFVWALAARRGGARTLHLAAAALGSAGLAVEFAHFTAGLEAAGLSPTDPRLLMSLGFAMMAGSRAMPRPLVEAGLPGRMWIALSSGIGVLAIVQGEAVTGPVALVLTSIAAGLVCGRVVRRRPAAADRPAHDLQRAA